MSISKQEMTPVGFEPHDHASCVENAMTGAEEHCAKSGLQLTPVRRRALEILVESHLALGAYDVLARLSKEGFGAQPPVAYRALEFLVKHGFAHRIERLNAYVACAYPSHCKNPGFMICRTCKSVAEAIEVPRNTGLHQAAITTGFEIETAHFEAEGICSACKSGSGHS